MSLLAWLFWHSGRWAATSGEFFPSFCELEWGQLRLLGGEGGGSSEGLVCRDLAPWLPGASKQEAPRAWERSTAAPCGCPCVPSGCLSSPLGTAVMGWH